MLLDIDILPYVNHSISKKRRISKLQLFKFSPDSALVYMESPLTNMIKGLLKISAGIIR